MDIASIGVRVESDGVEAGDAALEKFVASAEKAEGAEEALAKQSRSTSQAVAEVGAAASDSSKGLSAMQVSTQALAQAETAAQARIKEVVRSSLEKQQAMMAAASATKSAAKATDEADRAFAGLSVDKLGSSFAAAQVELDSFSDAMRNIPQSLQDIGERQEWLTDLYTRGLVSQEDYTAAGKTLEKQSRDLARAQADHARQIQSLLRTYDPASAAIARMANDQRLLNQALKSGAITQEQYSKAMAGLTVNRTKWLAEAKGVDELSKKINYMGLASNAAFRDYATLIGALGRGDISMAGNQFIQLGSRIGALRLLMTPVAAGIGAIAAVVGVLTYAIYNGEKELYELNKALILSGNAAGVSAGQVQLMADRLDDISTQGKAVKVLTALAASGEVAGENLEDFAKTAVLLERIGQPLEDTVRIFKELGRDPVEASKKLNKEYGYLTASVLKQIQELERQGRIEEAGALAQQTYAEEFKKRADKVQEHLGYLQRGAKATGKFFADMWDDVLGIGRERSPEKELEDLLQKRYEAGRHLGELPARTAGGRAGLELEGQRVLGARADDARERELKKIVAANQKAAEEQRKGREANAAAIAADEQTEKLRSANLNAAVAGRERTLARAVAGYSAYETQLDALRSAGLVSEQDYYAAKREIVQRVAAEQVKALDAESALLRAENQRREKDKEAAPEIIANQTKIADNEQKKLEIRIKAAAELGKLTVEEQGALDAIKQGYEKARASAQAYLEVVEQQRQRSLNAFGKGDRQRDYDSGVNDIEDRFAQERRRLDEQRFMRNITQEQYDELLRIAREFRDKDSADYEVYWKDLTDLQSQWLVGAQEAFANFQDSAANVAQQTEDLFTNAFDGMIDALIEFAQTGKLNFKSLAESIVADLLRIQLQAVASQIFGALSGYFNSGRNIAAATAGSGNAGSLTQTGPSMTAATGIMRVPRDNQPAILHKDEAVLPASMNPYNGKGSMGASYRLGDIYISGDNMSYAQIEAMVRQSQAETVTQVAESIHRGRWAEVMATS